MELDNVATFSEDTSGDKVQVADDFAPLIPNAPEQKKKSKFFYFLQKHGIFYLFLLPAFVAVLLFSYLPMPGLALAFKNYSITESNVYNYLTALFTNDETIHWIGFDNFIRLFSDPELFEVIVNTVVINLLALLIEFPMPIILALLLNEVQCGWFKKVAQTISYLPHFLSIASILVIFSQLFANDGLINEIRAAIMGVDKNYNYIRFLTTQERFIPNYILISVWQSVGWGSIIYLATLSSVSASLYEAASIDGANKFQQMLHVTLPALAPTISMLLILKMGSMLGSNFELTIGLQNVKVNYEVISTYVYKNGMKDADYISDATAMGFFQGVVSLILVTVANRISKAVSGSSIW